MSRSLLATFVTLGLLAPAWASAQRPDRGRFQRGDRSLEVRAMTPTEGPTGTQVTLRGEFPPDTEVTIARRPVPTTRGPGVLRFNIPSNAPPGSHRVELRAGPQRATAGEFRVGPAVARPAPPPPVASPRPPVRPAPILARMRRHREAAVVTGFTPHRGPAGTEVTIHGMRLDPSMRVAFGGRPIAGARVTPRTITFRVPPGAQTGVIELRQQGRPSVVVGTFRVQDRGAAARAAARAREREEQLRREAEAAWAARRATLAAQAAARLQALREMEEELRRSREERRLAQLRALQEQWEQAFLRRTEVRNELALHAERQARLERMLRLAEAEKQNLVVQIEMLIRREARRHEQRMRDLRAAFGV